MTREEHLEWCKECAREYLDQGDVVNAIASMLSDLSKHEETRAIGEKLGQLGMLYAMNRDHANARRFIEGFN
ncbi:MAG: hypothetical protein IH919_07945 [Deltaproteobacteria bacterium]|nr:hypothetical protein [Deltaproteobacteria bacterium]